MSEQVANKPVYHFVTSSPYKTAIYLIGWRRRLYWTPVSRCGVSRQCHPAENDPERYHTIQYPACRTHGWNIIWQWWLRLVRAVCERILLRIQILRRNHIKLVWDV